MSRVVFWAASISGAGLFLWPLLGLGPPGTGVALAVAVGAVGAMIALEAGSRRLDSRRLALLATLAAIDAGLRLVLVTGIEGFSPIFFLILCAGYAFGPSYGFRVGGMSLLVSALATGGVGPWLPFQVFAAGWVGAAAGLLSGLSGSVGPGSAGDPRAVCRPLWLRLRDRDGHLGLDDLLPRRPRFRLGPGT